MKKSIFTYVAVAIQALLLACFAFVIINNMPRQWVIDNDSLNILSPTNDKNATIQKTTSLKSFVAKGLFKGSDINNLYITDSLVKLHSSFLYMQGTNDSIELDVLHTSHSLLYYKVFDQKAKWNVAVYCPKDGAPRFAVMSKELVK